ncbi:MAG: DJ-1/PfpI family protein [Acholeplasmataceae bacterium]
MKKGVLYLNDRVEDGEALMTRALLKRAGFDITTATSGKQLDIRTFFGLQVKADTQLMSIEEKNYDFLVVPGGRYVSETIEHSDDIQALIRAFDQKNKVVAAICAGPRFLGRAGVLDGKKFTAFTGSEQDAPEGIYKPKLKVVSDGNIITARGAGAIYEFVFEIVSALGNRKQAKKLLADILY